MRITIITTSYPRYRGDGTAPFVKSIAQGLIKLGNDVEVVAPYDVEVDKSTPEDIKVHRFRYIWPEHWHIMGHARSLHADLRLKPAAIFLLPLFLLFSTYRLWRVASKNNSQVIYAHWILPSGVPAVIVSTLKKIPLSISLHGSDVYLAKSNFFFRLITRFIMNRTDVITACSEEMYQDAIELGSKQNIHLLAWGADPDRFRPEEGSPRRAATQDVADNKIVFSSLGRMVHKKGFHLLLKAMVEVIKSHPKAFLKIGGEGPLRSILLTEAQRMGIEEHVHLPGRIQWDQVPAFLQTSDIFVLPSIKDKSGNVDGLPTVLLEAMSTGKPVIASRIGGIPLVLENNRNGLIFTPGDVQSLSNLMIQLIEDENLRKRLGRSARRSICEKHNWQQVCETLESYFEGMIQKHSFTSRIGSMYRHSIWKIIKSSLPPGKILDVGCFDGYLLHSFNSGPLIGLDRTPIPHSKRVRYVQGNGIQLPFSKQTFDAVICLDTIEHVDNPGELADSLLSILAPGGTLILSTPSKEIRIGPEFLTHWISQRWGHHLRRGFSIHELEALFSLEGYTWAVQTWNAPFYRFLYIPLRILHIFSPRLIQKLLFWISRWDAQYAHGDHGFYFVTIKRESRPENIENNKKNKH